MALVVTGAVVGVFGGGGVSGAAATNGESLTVEYSRVSRARSPDELTIDWQPGAEQSEIWIARAYLEAFEVSEIRPAPAAVSIDRDRIYYTFRTRDPAARAQAKFIVKPEHGGTFRARIGAADGLELEIWQLVLP